MRALWLSVLVCLSLSGIVVGSEDGSSDAEKIQGTWSVVSFEGDGVKVPAERLKGGTVVITATKFALSFKGEKEETDIKIDASKKPKYFDLLLRKDTVAPGIYLLEGDDLTLCWDADKSVRPTKFTSKGEPLTDFRLLVLKREKKNP